MAKPCKILCVGLMCHDIVNHVDHYPEEDEDMRVQRQTRQSGGNCTNTSKVLALLGRQCEFLGTLGTGTEAEFGTATMDSYGISHHNCPVHTDCSSPVSYITLNTSNGSRTILHHRSLPDLSFEDFMKVDITEFGWIHFEGRNPVECTKMVKYIREKNQELAEPIVISIELEKRKPEILCLFPLPDLVIVSQVMARYCDCNDKTEAVTKLRRKIKEDALLVCTWGEEGAAASDQHGKVYESRAYPPHQLVDTLGAGDTFNAGLIHSLSEKRTLEESMDFACRLAGAKCGMLGYEGLKLFHCS